MKIAQLSIERPVATLMFYVAVVLLGFISLNQLSVDLLPDISYPRLSVVTRYPGVAPEEVEILVTVPLEASVSRIPGLRRVESVSKEGVSFMTLEFAWGTDMDFALLHTREKLDSTRYGLPEDAENPTIIPLDPQSKPIMVITVGGSDSLLELKEFSEELIKPRLEQIEGIGIAEVAGGVEREIHIEMNPELLSLYGLTIEQVSQKISASNQNLQGGTIRKGKFKYALRILGEFEGMEEIRETTLKATEEKGVIRLRDVAKVSDSLKEREGMTRLNGGESIGILVRKESGANTIKVTQEAKKVLEEVKKQNPRIDLHVVSEEAKHIENAISSVKEEILGGGILAFLVLLLFLQEIRTASIIFAVIAISVIATFNLLFFRNITLNIMSLGGLALGVGMLDDCAIVVSENIFRHKSLGKKLSEAAYTGTKEVGMAVSAAIFTTIVVFLPVIYVHGVAGQLFRDQALTVTFSLLASLIVSLTLVPLLSSREFNLEKWQPGTVEGQTQPGLSPRKGRKSIWTYLSFPFKALRRLVYFIPKALVKALGFLMSLISQVVLLLFHYISLPFRPAARAVFKGFNSLYSWFTVRYHQFLAWSLDHKGKVMAVSLAFFGLTFLLGWRMPRELMPKVRVSSFEVRLKTPVEYSFEQTAEIVSAVEAWLAGQKPVRTFYSQTGLVSGMEVFNPDVSVNSAQIRVEVNSASHIDAVIEGLRARLRSFPGLTFSVFKEQTTIAQFLAFTPAELGLKIKGDELDVLKEIAQDLSARLKEIKGITDINTNIEEGKPEYLIKAKKDMLQEYNLSPDVVGTFIVNAVRGKKSSQFRELERKYDILVRLDRETRENIENLLNQRLLHQGRFIPLRDLVYYEVSKGPEEIRRENQQREVLVTANIRGTKISRVMPEVNKKIAALDLPPNYRIVFGGEQEEMGRSFRSLIWAFLLSALLVYMIMAAQFESLLHPFLIMFTIPMGLAGSFIALILTGHSINVISIIGIIVSVGIVTDNAIVKLDCTNQLRRGGMPLRQAVVESSNLRLRPILMTSATTVFGLLPLSLGLGEGAELQQSLGVAVIGGLIFSTFLTLILIPVVYELAEGRRERKNS